VIRSQLANFPDPIHCKEDRIKNAQLSDMEARLFRVMHLKSESIQSIEEYLAFIDSWLTEMEVDVINPEYYLRYQEYRWCRHEKYNTSNQPNLIRTLVPEWIDQRFDTQLLPKWDRDYHLKMRPEFVTVLPVKQMNVVIIEETRYKSTPLNAYLTNKLVLVMSAVVLRNFGLKARFIRFSLLDSLTVHEERVTSKLISWGMQRLRDTLTNGVMTEAEGKNFNTQSERCLWCRYFIICRDLIEVE
jgi:hypothetical protein